MHITLNYVNYYRNKNREYHGTGRRGQKYFNPVKSNPTFLPRLEISPTPFLSCFHSSNVQRDFFRVARRTSAVGWTWNWNFIHEVGGGEGRDHVWICHNRFHFAKMLACWTTDFEGTALIGKWTSAAWSTFSTCNFCNPYNRVMRKCKYRWPQLASNF